VIAAPPLQPTRTRYAVLLFVYLAAFITYLDRVCLSVSSPAMQADLGISQVQFAWVFTVFYVAYAVFEMPTSWLGDRWGQRRMLVRIVGCWSMFTLFTGLARSFGDAGDAYGVRRRGGRRVPNALPCALPLVSDP
jgi:ACS family glucarate transporter-like MFS transporter